MPFQPGNKLGGRPAGVPNKWTREVKDALAEAFEKLGGVPSLVKWGQNNPDAFYPLWSKLLPHQIANADGGPVTFTIVSAIPATPECIDVEATVVKDD